MRSSVVTVTEMPDEAALPVGWVLAGVLPAELDPAYPYVRYVLHVEPGRPVAEFAPLQVIVDGSAVDWQPAEIAAAWPNGSLHVLEAAWELDGVHGRSKVADVPPGAVVSQTHIVPHHWAGEQVPA